MVATAVVDYAIDLMNLNPLVSFAWTTAQMVGGLISTSDSQINGDNQQKRTWEYLPFVTDAGQFFTFLVDVTPNQTAYFTHEYDVHYVDFSPNHHVHLGPFLIECTAPGPQSEMTEGWNPGLMTAEEKEKYGIEEIPRLQFQACAGEIGLRSETVDEFMKSGEPVFYIAHKAFPRVMK